MSLIALAADAAANSGEAPAFPPFETWHFPSQLFWLTLLFGGLYIVLSRMILPRLSATMERRGDHIASDLDQAARLDEQAVEAQQALELRMAEARAKARDMANDARSKMEDEIARDTAKVDADMDEKLAEAEARISELRADAMANVESVATDAASAITGRFGVKPSAGEVASAVKAVLN